MPTSARSPDIYAEANVRHKNLLKWLIEEHHFNPNVAEVVVFNGRFLFYGSLVKSLTDQIVQMDPKV